MNLFMPSPGSSSKLKQYALASVGSKNCLVPAGYAPEQASGLLCSGTGPRQPPAHQLVPEQASSLQASGLHAPLECTGAATGSCWLLPGNGQPG